MKINTKLVGLSALAFSALFLATSAEAQCRDGKNRKIKVINDTTFSLRELYGSNVGADSWQEDVLGRKVLGPGQTVTVNFDDGSCYCQVMVLPSTLPSVISAVPIAPTCWPVQLLPSLLTVNVACWSPSGDFTVVL